MSVILQTLVAINIGLVIVNLLTAAFWLTMLRKTRTLNQRLYDLLRHWEQPQPSDGD